MGIPELQLPYIETGNTHAWMMYPIVLNPFVNGSAHLKGVLLNVLNERGIQTRDMPTLINHPDYDWLDKHMYPVSRWIDKSGFYVGCHQDLTIEDIDWVADSIMHYIRNLRHNVS